MKARVLACPANGKQPLKQLRELAAALKACKVCAFPTDTVYGLGSTGLLEAALRRIYRIKGRDPMKPLPILVKSTEEAKRWTMWTPQADRLASRFWPGPLTIVLRPSREGRLLPFREFSTLGVRVPAHPTIRDLLTEADIPIASTSANLSGQAALARGEEVVGVFGDLVDYILDAGEVAGIESTVVDATGEPARVLREGKIPMRLIFGGP